MNTEKRIKILESIVTECPKCGSEHIRQDYDNPDTMRVCKSCLADFTIDGELILNPENFK